MKTLVINTNRQKHSARTQTRGKLAFSQDVGVEGWRLHRTPRRDSR